MLNWQWHTFNELTQQELYEVLRLRAEVFIVEQKCVWQDIDNQDQNARHLLGKLDNILVAYLRVLPPNPDYGDWMSIGRVITAAQVRGMGLGKQAMNEALRYLKEHRNNKPVVISAQTYLEKFYGEFGFQSEGDRYDEDGIEHIRMRLATA
jgi:ElaA protein